MFDHECKEPYTCECCLHAHDFLKSSTLLSYVHVYPTHNSHNDTKAYCCMTEF